MFCSYVAYVCIVYNDVCNVHWQTIYCEKFTVEETGHFTWAMFRQHDSWIISNIIFEAHTEIKLTKLGCLDLLYSYVFDS